MVAKGTSPANVIEKLPVYLGGPPQETLRHHEPSRIRMGSATFFSMSVHRARTIRAALDL